jgi:ketosteroid isomerase-like protein
MTAKSILSLVVAGLVLSQVAQSQSAMSADEQAIRDIIAKGDAGERIEETSNAILFTGAFMRPVVRGEAPAELRPEVKNRVPGTQRATSTIRRIEVSASGDMAYIFSDASVTGQTKAPDGQVGQESFSNSSLRVFRKVNGKWLQAAALAGPHPR